MSTRGAWRLRSLMNSMDAKPSFLSRQKKSFSFHHLWIPAALLCFLFGMFFVGMIAYANTYADRVLPGMSLGDISIGGMTRIELQDFIEEMHGKISGAGITVSFRAGSAGSESFVLYPSVVSEDTVLDFVSVDSVREAERLVQYGKKGKLAVRAWMPLVTRARKPSHTLQFMSLDTERLFSALQDRLKKYEQPARDAGVLVQRIVSKEEVVSTVTTSSLGIAFNYDTVAGQVTSAWSAFQFPSISMQTRISEPAIVESDIASIIERLPAFFAAGGMTLAYADPHTKRERTWVIAALDLADWIRVQKAGQETAGFGIAKEMCVAFLEKKVRSAVDIAPRDAKFKIGDSGKVLEFQGSRTGVSLLMDQTCDAVNTALMQRTWDDENLVSSLALITETIEPNIKTGEINDLGIDEVLGVGYSNYSGSPPNRIKNIRHAVYNKLNGVLIKPGDTFSALAALRPFTIDAGYLPELVIKGDKITPEIGGGLCQIGSTLFRMAMNSGMPILERRNHSLVVTYYNDPRNGNPGTDATIYDSAPDFKFKNDTGNYILLATEMNEKTGDLFFTLWGTNDGRKGYYTEPVVHQRIPAGEPRYVESVELALGEEKCQSGHAGAVASFTYVVERPDGVKEEKEFRSHYRPLPKICVVGVLPTVAAQEVPPDATDPALGEETAKVVEVDAIELQ